MNSTNMELHNKQIDTFHITLSRWMNPKKTHAHKIKHYVLYKLKQISRKSEKNNVNKINVQNFDGNFAWRCLVLILKFLLNFFCIYRVHAIRIISILHSITWHQMQKNFVIFMIIFFSYIVVFSFSISEFYDDSHVTTIDLSKFVGIIARLVFKIKNRTSRFVSFSSLNFDVAVDDFLLLLFNCEN